MAELLQLGDLVEFTVQGCVKRGEVVHVDPPIMRDADVHAYVLLREGAVAVVGRAARPAPARAEVLARIAAYARVTGSESAAPTGHGAPPTG